jgi:aldehyde:ferredoxin oxidoreductase
MGDKLQHPEVFMGSKGQEFPAYDPRAFQGMGVAYATCNRGACHLRAWTPGPETSGKMDRHTPDGKGEWVARAQDRTTAHDNTGLCMFVGAGGAGPETFVPCLAAATGVDYTLASFLEAGERTWNLERLWNQRAGFTGTDDALPRRLLEEGLKTGPTAGRTVDLDTMLRAYYRERGWSADGVPDPEKLLALGLATL